jgi:hypothetical protein
MSEFLLKNVRCSFPVLATPQVAKAFPNSPAMYSVDLIMPKTDPVFAALMQDYVALANAEWKAMAPQVMQMIQGDKKARSYGSGVERINQQTLARLDGYGDDDVFISAKASVDRQPQMIKPDGKPVEPNDTITYQKVARTIYGGCYVNAVVKPWLRIANRGVSFQLIAIQFAADGTAFGEKAPDVSGMFGAVAAPASAAPTPGGITLPAFLA